MKYNLDLDELIQDILATQELGMSTGVFDEGLIVEIDIDTEKDMNYLILKSEASDFSPEGFMTLFESTSGVYDADKLTEFYAALPYVFMDACLVIQILLEQREQTPDNGGKFVLTKLYSDLSNRFTPSELKKIWQPVQVAYGVEPQTTQDFDELMQDILSDD